MRPTAWKVERISSIQSWPLGMDGPIISDRPRRGPSELWYIVTMVTATARGRAPSRGAGEAPGTARRVAVERVQTGVRMEKRLVKVLKALAELKDLSLGDLLEGIVLHAFDGKSRSRRRRCARSRS